MKACRSPTGPRVAETRPQGFLSGRSRRGRSQAGGDACQIRIESIYPPLQIGTARPRSPFCFRRSSFLSSKCLKRAAHSSMALRICFIHFRKSLLNVCCWCPVGHWAPTITCRQCSMVPTVSQPFHPARSAPSTPRLVVVFGPVLRSLLDRYSRRAGALIAYIQCVLLSGEISTSTCVPVTGRRSLRRLKVVLMRPAARVLNPG